MKKCAEFMDMLSAYADGELSGAETRQVEAHVSTCGECAALLEMYREISVAAVESLEPVPGTLRSSVMDKINAEPAPFKAKQQLKRHIMLARYIPVAACLAVAVLIWGYYGGPLGLRYGGTGSAPAQAPALMMDEAVSSEVYVAADSDAAEESAVNYDDSLGGGPAGQRTQPAPMPAAEAEPGSAGGDTGGGMRDTGAAGGMAAEEIAGYSKITADEAKQIMNEAEQYIILDVRTEDEYSKLRIKGAILIPHTDISANAPESLPDLDGLIFVYCQAGVRSAAASGALAQMGYTRVYDIGGIAAWPYETESD